MDIPPTDQWMTITETAKWLGVSRTAVENAMKYGKKSKTGDNVSLERWRVIGKGWVTTREAVVLFHKRLNS